MFRIRMFVMLVALGVNSKNLRTLCLVPQFGGFK